MAPANKLLRFFDHNDEDIIIYADSITRFQAFGVQTSVFFEKEGTESHYVLNMEMEELVQRIHLNPDEFEIITIPASSLVLMDDEEENLES
jgi:hypothetical protein